MTTAPERCTHSFPDPYPQPIDQPGDCRGCGITYQAAKDAAAMTTTYTPDPEPDDEDNGPWCRTEQP